MPTRWRPIRFRYQVVDERLTIQFDFNVFVPGTVELVFERPDDRSSMRWAMRGHHVIGDIQGCWDTLESLLNTFEIKPDRDAVICTGDLVNRGPNSLAVLRWAMRNGVQTVLGNHDLYLLGLWADAVKPKNHTLGDVLNAPDAQALCDWLRSQPLVIDLPEHMVIHAALDPNWSDDDTVYWAEAIQRELTGSDWASFLKASWNTNGRKTDPLQYALACLTRGRGFTFDGQSLHGFKGPPETAPQTVVHGMNFQSVKVGKRPLYLGTGQRLVFVRCLGPSL